MITHNNEKMTYLHPPKCFPFYSYQNHFWLQFLKTDKYVFIMYYEMVYKTWKSCGCTLTRSEVTFFFFLFTLPHNWLKGSKKQRITSSLRQCSILNDLGSPPGPAANFLYELGISFHLLQISVCFCKNIQSYYYTYGSYEN